MKKGASNGSFYPKSLFPQKWQCENSTSKYGGLSFFSISTALKGNTREFSLNEKKIITDGNFEMQEDVRVSKNSKYVGKSK